MRIDYKKELETAAKTMILIHKPETLIKMIVRMIVRKVKITHAGILLQDTKRGGYTFTVSRGIPGLKIPAGYARVRNDNPLIKIFTDKKLKSIINDGVLVYDDVKKLLKRKTPHKDFIIALKSQLDMFETQLCVPSYMPVNSVVPQPRVSVSEDIFLSAIPDATHIQRDALLGILLLGKKLSNKKFLPEEIDFFNALSNDVAMAIRNAQLFEELQLELGKKYRLFIHTTIALAAAIDAKDHYTRGHTERVTDYSLLIAKKFISTKNKNNFSQRFLENLHISALLHDIGKIGISELILNKNGPLTEEERDKIQEHPLIGVAILQPIKELAEPIDGVKYHHEHYDGTGYPEGLKGDKIPMIAAIIAVADVFDALTTDRPYRHALSKEEALREIEKASATQFRPDVVQALLELHKEGKI